MSLTIAQLKAKWNKDKEHYKKQELGSGVQSFIKDCLESSELFALKQGALSTKDETRSNQFIYEKQAKEKGRADFAIYINPEIIIPVEVECYENIQAGVKQLFEYQKGFDKSYGLLTDGYKWRLYNNNIYREYALDQIFDRKSEFWTYWGNYIQPEFYYLSFFEPIGQQTIFEEKLPVEVFRQLFFEDITGLIRRFKDKLKIEGYFPDMEKKEKEKKAVEITYAYIIQFILYKTLVDNAFDEFPKKFFEAVKNIHANLKIKQYKNILGVIDGLTNEISQNIYRSFAKEQEIINQKLKELYRIENKLDDVAPWLDIFVFIKKYSFSNIRNEIFGYIYENYLKDLYEDKKKGQYFTDPAVVNFMLEEIGWTEDKLQKCYSDDKDSLSLIDLACGSGTFLYSAVDKLVKTFDKGNLDSAKQIEEIVSKNIFGLDIAEFPLYLAEMNILMRLLPLIITEKYNNPIDKKIQVFKTNDSLAEFGDTALRNTISDIDVAYAKNNGQGELFSRDLNLGYSSYVRDEDDLKEMKKSLENQPKCPRRRFDYVISNPPYVSYNECSKQKVLIFEWMKQGRTKLNNIYGVNLHSTPDNPKKYAPKPNLYAFFIGLGIALLKDKGKLCYIIPQTILTAGDLDVLRYYLAKFTTIEKIITFSGKMFIGRGLKQDKPVATSSLVFVLNKKKPSVLNQVEIINYKDSNDTIKEVLQNILIGKTSKKIEKKKILQNKLLQNVANWNFIKQSKKFLDFYEEYQKNTQDISIYYEHILAKQRFRDRFYFDGSFNIPTKDIQTKKIDDNDYWEIPYLKSEGLKVKINGFYPKNIKIKIAQGSQGMKMLDTKYKVIWRYVNPNKFFFIEGKNILPRFQQFCIASNKKGEILYLLSLLNSKMISLLFKNLLRNEQEKDVLMGVSVIKEFVRIPKITQDNQYIKDEVIKGVEEMLALEEKILSDFVDFSGVMVQKFDDIVVEGNNLVLTKDDEQVKCEIKSQAKLVAEVIKDKYQGELKFEKGTINLSELRFLPAIDFERQKTIKDYLDDLIFALYFNVRIKNIGLENAETIKVDCSTNSNYFTQMK